MVSLEAHNLSKQVRFLISAMSSSLQKWLVDEGSVTTAPPVGERGLCGTRDISVIISHTSN